MCACVCVYVCEPQLSQTTEWSIAARFYWDQLPSILSAADLMLRSTAESAKHSGTRISPALHHCPSSQPRLIRINGGPWQSDTVTNDGHLPRMKVLRKTNLITIAPCCLSMFREISLSELQGGKQRHGPGLSIYTCNKVHRLSCLSAGLLSCHSRHIHSLLLSASALFY